MSLMLNALKRIEAKQTPARAEKITGPDEPIALPSAAAPAELFELPLELPPPFLADAAPSLPQEAAAPLQPVSVSLDTAMDQIQAMLSEAALLYAAEAKFDAGEAALTAPVDLPFEAAIDTVDEAPIHLADDSPIDSAIFTPDVPDPYAATAQRILQQLPRGRSQVLLFTSPADGQGTTMTLARLAPMLAQGLEGNVLVVDANSGNPDMAGRLAVVPTWRLPDVLAGAADWATAVQATAHQRLSLPGGSVARDRGWDVQGMGQLLRDLAGRYELVAVDAPSLGHCGTAQLAAICDATYLVVRLGEGSSRMLREAVQIVNRHGGRLLGCVAIDGGT